MKDIRKYLLDIIITIDDLESFALSFTLQDLKEKKNQWSVERAISIIGEAAYQVWKMDKTLSISNWEQIMGTRHIIVHDYDRVDNARLIVIIQKHLPILKSEVEAILKELS